MATHEEKRYSKNLPKPQLYKLMGPFIFAGVRVGLMKVPSTYIQHESCVVNS